MMASAVASPPAHLHPVTLMSEKKANTCAGSRAAHDASVQLKESTSLPAQLSAHKEALREQSVAAVSSRRVPLEQQRMPSYASTSSTQEASSEQQQQQPCYGLFHNHDYPAHPLSNGDVKLLSAHDYAALAAQELAYNTPEQVLFPWLHGADQLGTHQALYFGCTPSSPSHPPRFRGLVPVSCDAEPQAPHGRSASFASSSFNSSTSISSYSSNSSSSAASDESSDLFNARMLPNGPEPRPAQLVSSFTPDELLHPSCEPPVFNVPQLPPAQINLRNFKLQACKMASISDIVVYSADGMASPDLLPTAERFVAAQKHTRRLRAMECGLDEEELLGYNVFVITDRFETFERRLPHLVAVSSNGFRRNKIDFFEQEKQEMRLLTQASPIADGVWLGNTADVPLPQEPPSASSLRTPQGTHTSSADAACLGQALEQPTTQLRRNRLASSDSSSSLEQDTIEDGNPHKFNICIEAHDQAVMPTPEDFKQIDAYFQTVDPKSIEPRQIVHLETTSSSQVCVYPEAVDQMVERVINLVVWIRQQAKPSSASTPPSGSAFSVRGRKVRAAAAAAAAARQPRNVLIHTADGYTDSSLLALAYVMYDRGCTLPQAYLHLQNTAGRSFFVYPADVTFLSKIEVRLSALANDARRGTSIDEEPESPSAVPSLLRGRFSSSRNASSPAPPKTPQPMNALERCLAAPWFYSDRFDGHFPSRILPFLYLGNINHASNALMLKELGITHVVSIGESALVPPKSPSPSTPVGVPHSAKARLPNNSLWLEASLGNIQVLDLPGIADDGIDSIRPFMEASERFIEQARVTGGKVLVHCRVGVSRSATLVIAFVMKHLGIDLQSAYLLVRARRLNILIQPTVPFFWSLQWYEAKLNRERAAAGLKPLGSELQFGYLSRQLYIINQRYLGF